MSTLTRTDAEQGEVTKIEQAVQSLLDRFSVEDRDPVVELSAFFAGVTALVPVPRGTKIRPSSRPRAPKAPALAAAIDCAIQVAEQILRVDVDRHGRSADELRDLLRRRRERHGYSDEGGMRTWWTPERWTKMRGG
jgi:hypothetical protein